MKKFKDLDLKKKILALFMFVLVIFSIGLFFYEINNHKNQIITLKCSVFEEQFNVTDQQSINKFIDTYCYKNKKEFNIIFPNGTK